MRIYEASTEVEARPSAVIEILTDPAACRVWSPVDFEIDAGEDARLREGETLEVAGRVAGQRVSFDLSVLEASRRALRIAASGPFEMTARYEAREASGSTELKAEVSVSSKGGIRGRIASSAAEALLSAGVLDRTLERIAKTAAVPA